MNVEITPEPSDEEREAILAALQDTESETSNVRKPWQEEPSEP
jgi:hypothetical protein